MPSDFRPIYKVGPYLNTNDTEVLGAYVQRELARIAESFQELAAQTYTTLKSAPTKEPAANEAKLAYFDFGPPGLRGFYYWDGTQWNKL